MEALIGSLERIAKQKRLVPAEQIICNLLLDFEKTVPEKLTDEDGQALEKVLLPLFNINGGDLSMQCANRIAKCLIKIYNSQASPKLWDLVTLVTKKPNQANIIGITLIIDQLGHTFKSMLPGLVQKIIPLIPKLQYPCLMALAACYRVDKTGLKSNADDAFQITTKHIANSNETYQLAAVRFFIALLATNILPTQKFINIANVLLKHAASTFVTDEVCFLIAQIAYLPFSLKGDKQQQSSDFSISKKGGQTGDEPCFEEAFGILVAFKQNFPMILQHFLDLLQPQTVHKNLPLLFNFVRKTMQSEIVQLMSLFGTDVRKELFTSVAHEQPPTAAQLLLLRALSCDYTSIREIAALALQLTQSGNSSARRTAASYYANLCHTHPEHARLYLETATLFLAKPPDNNPNADNDFQGMATIATYILGASKNRLKLADEMAANIGMFLNRALMLTDIFDIQFWSAFSLMTVLPRCLVPHELVSAALDNFIAFFDNQITIGDARSKRMKNLGLALSLFLVQHSNYEQGPRILQLLMDQYCLQCQTSRLAVFLAGPKIIPKTPELTSIVLILLEPILKSAPSSEYSRERIKCPMPSSIDLLQPLTFKQYNYEIIFDKIATPPFNYYTIENFSNLVAALEENALRILVDRLLHSYENSLMGHNLLLSIVNDPKTRNLLPSGIHVSLIEMMNDNADLIQQQVSAEVVGIWVKDDIEAINQIIQILQKQRSRTKCLIYSAIIAHASLDENLISLMMHELNDIAKNTNATPYALHALSVLYSCHSIMLSAMKVTDIQCQAIIQILNSPVILNPFNLYYLSLCFQNILPIISPEIQDSRASVVPIIRQIIQAFRQIKIPFSSQIMFRILRPVFAFARDLIDPEPVLFPSHQGASIPLQLAACGAFADMLKVPSPNDPDFFDYIPRILILLQRSGDKRADQFVNAVANVFAEQAVGHEDDENIRQRLTQWIRHIKSILSASAIPNTGDATIEADYLVKNCALSVAKTMLPILSKSRPLLTECLDDVMTSTTRAIETGKEELVQLSFQLMHMIIVQFEGVITDDGSRLLELYDSQFAIAVRFGFHSDLALSGPFLIKFLSFHYDNLKNRPEEFMTVLTGFVNGLTVCKQRTFAYYNISSHLCSIARQNEAVFKLTVAFSEKLVPDFGEIIKHSMTLWRGKPTWREVAQFRLDYENFYRELTTSFVWLQHHFKLDIIKIADLVDFFIGEIMTCTESWRILSAFEALAATFMYYDDEITEENVANAISAVRKASQLSSQLLSYALPSFLLSCSRLIKPGNDETWEHLIEFALKSTFSLESLAHLVMKGPTHAVDNLAEEISDNVLKELKNNSVDTLKAVAFFAVLFSRSASSASKLTKKVYADEDLKHHHLQFVLDLSKRALLAKGDVDRKVISEFAWKNFMKGGMVFLADLLIADSEIGAEVVSSDDFKTMEELCANDINNVVVFMQFIRLAIISIEKSSLPKKHEILAAAAKIAIVVISNFGTDVQRGKDIVSTAVNVIQDVKKIDESAVKDAFNAASQRQKQTTVQSTEKQISKLETRKKVRTLKTFGTIRKRERNDDDEWQSLD